MTDDTRTTTDATDDPVAAPGSEFHFLKTGIIWRAKPAELFGTGSLVSQRGETFEITVAMLEASPWIGRYLGDEAAQNEKWGEVRIGVGPFPSTASRWVRNSPDWEEAREAARLRAWAIADPEERAQARAAVEAEFGPAPTTSQATEIREHYTERLMREQRERLDRGIPDRKH